MSSAAECLSDPAQKQPAAIFHQITDLIGGERKLLFVHVLFEIGLITSQLYAENTIGEAGPFSAAIQFLRLDLIELVVYHQSVGIVFQAHTCTYRYGNPRR